MEAGNETHEETNSGRPEPPTESWSEQMETQDWVQSQNLASQSAALFSGRSSLTMRTPPPQPQSQESRLCWKCA
jgi:hypothetical protein